MSYSQCLRKYPDVMEVSGEHNELLTPTTPKCYDSGSYLTFFGEQVLPYLSLPYLLLPKFSLKKPIAWCYRLNVYVPLPPDSYVVT